MVVILLMFLTSIIARKEGSIIGTLSDRIDGMVTELEYLAKKYAPGIMTQLREVIALQKAKEPFNKRALKLIWEAEKTIPGAGIHYSLIKGGRYSYPADYKFQNIVRPLRYSLNELSYTYAEVSSARCSIEASGGHLEGCMKTLGRIS